MADKLAELIVEINVKLDNLKKGLSEAEKEVKTTGTSIGTTLQKALPYAAIAAGVAVIGVAFKKVLTDAAEFGQEISKAITTTGLSSDFIQDLKYNTDILGISFGTLATAIGTMNTKLTDASLGKDSAVKLFKDLGLSLEYLLSLNPDQRFKAISDAISKIPDDSLRAGMAIKVFGASGDNLLPLIEKVNMLKDSLHLSADEIENLKKGSEAMKEMGLKWEILKTKFAAVIWPNLQPFLDGLSKAVSLLGDLLNWWNSLNAAWQTVAKVVFPFAGILPSKSYFPAPTSQPATQSASSYIPYNRYQQGTYADESITQGIGLPYGTNFMASGGIVDKPTLAMIGEAGPEAVVPLSGGGIGGGIHLHIGNFLGDESAIRTLARKLNEIIKEEGRRTTYTPNLTEIYQVGGKV